MKSVMVALLMVSLLASSSSALSRGFDSNLKAEVKVYRFPMVRWQLGAMQDDLVRFFQRPQRVEDETSQVNKYFATVERINTLAREINNPSVDKRNVTSLEAELKSLQEQQKSAEDGVKRTITNQIRTILAEQGIFRFPGVNFKLEKPPNLLVVSPRDRIESLREITLKSGLPLHEIEEIEAKVDKLGVSALVVPLGGLGATYPTFVSNEAGLRFTLDTAIHEWLHQYLTFKPLGFRYLLDVTGIARNYDIATMDETAVGMAAKELSAMVYERYYSGDKDSIQEVQHSPSGFDFNREMREIRQTVDTYLASADITAAEKFMAEKQQYLASKGYNIRKLNQAYFAFYGTYADGPTSVSPIGTELKQLRAQSASLKDFLHKVAGMTSRQALRNSLK